MPSRMDRSFKSHSLTAIRSILLKLEG